ncbi:MAG: chorismate synthase [Bacteroidales bacterium]|nr:chorismate synthase [Bacteroidales bacterium]
MNSFGTNFRVEIFGESHGVKVGVVIDGCPSGIALCEEDFLTDLQRRRSGKLGTTPRIEADMPHIVSGVFEGRTCGTPITILFDNTNTKSGDYANLQDHPRPGHADYTGMVKYGGYNDPRGGGHFSGRITLGLVAAGVIAKKIIDPIEISATLTEVGGRTDIDECIKETMQKKDSVGGMVSCTCKNVPVGLGEPFFDSVESEIAHIIFSIPAIKSIEFGSGIAAAKMLGSEHNDRIIDASGKTETNYAGGINGGITNGNDIEFRIAVKPTASISQAQNTYNFASGQVEPLEIVGRHDACIAVRVPVVVECATAIVLADLMLRAQ